MRTQVSAAAMAEWLRRWTRNPMGSSRVGSNPTRSARFFLLFLHSYYQSNKEERQEKKSEE